MKNQDIDIIIFALTRFDGPYSSISISMAKEFSKKHRVFYVNHPYSLKDIFTSVKTHKIIKRLPALFCGINNHETFRIGESSNQVTMVTPPVTLPINFLPQGKWYNFLQKVNDKILFWSLRKLIKREKINDFIFINTYDPFFALNFPNDIKPNVKIYQCVDDIEEVEYTQKHGTDSEKRMMREYDLTLTTSRELTKIKRDFAKSIHYLPNAVDPSLFNQAFFQKLEIPKEFEGVSKKVIGYIGNIERRMDYDLVKKIAFAHQDKLLYLIGPISSNEYKTEGLDKIENIVFTGGKNIEQLPAYLQNIDCAIIPFKCNKLTRSIYPLKINEYLAGGKPVITTNFSEDIRMFSDVVYIARDHDDFISLIAQSLEENDNTLAMKRLEHASRNSWASRVEDFWGIVDNYKDKRTKNINVEN